MRDVEVRRHVLAAVVTVVAVVVMTVAAELSAAFKGLLKGWLYHHWIGKGVVALLVFFVVAHVVKIDTKMSVAKLVRLLVVVTLVGAVVIFVFFVWHAVRG